MDPTCANCRTQFNDRYQTTYLIIIRKMESHGRADYPLPLCSLTCLTEQAWALREAQPKMSKSTP